MVFFKNPSLRKKLSIYFILILIILIVVVLTSNLSVSSISNQYTDMINLSLNLNNYFNEINAAKSAYTVYFSSKSDDDIQKYNTAILNSKNIIETLKSKTIDEDVLFNYNLLLNMIETYDEQASDMIKYNQASMTQEAYAKMQEANRVNELINLQFKPYFTLQIKLLQDNMDQMNKNIGQYQIWTNLIMTIGVIISSMFIISFTKTITRPINLLADNAKRVTENDFEIEPLYLNTGDEINLLADAFNEMISSIHFYIKEVEESAEVKEKLLFEENINLKMQHMLKESQLKVLQDKINPHFLFNTLNILYQTAYIEGANKTMEMLYATSKILRYGMDELERSVSIKQELEAVRYYIYIQEQRFGNRIEFIIDEKRVQNYLNFRMPALIIQPIIENAVTHGLALTPEGGKIFIQCYIKEDKLIIEIIDNGCGMKEETIQRMLLGDYNENDGIGIRNVIERLELFYSEKSEIHIFSELNKGTKITFLLPLN
jgi:nitrogen fixation/metabolism regulation signal transduction histidine kinase